MRRGRLALHARTIAFALVGEPWTRDGLHARLWSLLGARPRNPDPLLRATLQAFPELPRGREHEVADHLARLDALRAFVARCDVPLARNPPLRSPEVGRTRLTPIAPLPELATAGDLATFLDLDVRTLDWLADLRGLERVVPRGALRRYDYRTIAKRSGGVRLLEVPRRRLREAQRRVLHAILDGVPPHPAAIGFVRGRSVVDHARAHAGSEVVIGLDLADFFASVSRARVRAVFVALGYPLGVARLLAGLATNLTPRSERPPSIERDAWAHLRAAHLPQGAPTSPALANLVLHGLDVRVAAFARTIGARYSRYADDVVLSGGDTLARASSRVLATVSAIVIEEGFTPRWRKTRVMRASARQRVGGLVVNAAPAVARAERERLEATLVNCARHGPAGQNRAGVSDLRAHLEGRVAWVAQAHAGHGEKLRALLACIDWTR